MSKSRVHSCNVVQSVGTNRQLWQFSASNEVALSREHAAPVGQFLPESIAQKNWQQLWQPRLNIAWLPPESVFFRVVHLPPSNLAETLSMVELQLEKLSPVPLGQAVWSIHIIPPQKNAGANDLQTVVIVFAERKHVEEHLGQLEADGYLADRIELQALDQIAAAKVETNGAWIYPGLAGGSNTALVAWWYGGKLQTLNSLILPTTGERADALKEQLSQMAWAGELEGWLTALPSWTLVADDESVAQWEAPLRKGLDAPIHLVKPVKLAELAALTAKRSAASDGKANLIPAEYATRYRNQFLDRLWIRGALAVAALYLICVAVYFAIVGVQDYRVDQVESKIAGLGEDYTNSIQMRERYQILKTRQELKFAALDCWKAVAENLPETVTMETMGFSDGRKLTLNGTAPQENNGDILKFYSDVRKANSMSNQPLFDLSKGKEPELRLGPGGTVVNWSFNLDLKRTEAE
jgi:hypothetical protein